MLKYTVSLAIVLAIIWLLFSGMWTHPIIVPLGAASVALTVWLATRMKIVDREGHPLHLIVPSLKYWPWLLLEIVKSNITVARHVLAGKGSINPRLSRVKASQKTELGRTIYANSITLTPGTVTVHVRDNEIWFYALSEAIEQGVLNGEMDRRATEFEGEK
ncbi:Na+/H+ antiporter subunit E [Natronospira bacteriovora]|uniref:Na+/H+ antiporter subunit E n=1 Tax=Natronospira bacteriovora TaxID=3069753 RepID=A0ABU0W4L6_9GAMM|nr:Na+/H+ antiporter subunit E [Natronospira sp. AB-CW4]MDQ2068967.1 Na+/H+ antiporter subunit E [Natronospira sp. AB-CW4]